MLAVITFTVKLRQSFVNATILCLTIKSLSEQGAVRNLTAKKYKNYILKH